MTGQDPTPRSPGHVGGRNLPAAIVVGLVLAAVFLGTLFWHPLAFGLVVAILVGIAYVEADRVLRQIGIRLLVPVLTAASLTMLAGAYYAGHAGQVGGVAVLLVGAMVWLLLDARRHDVVRTLGATLLFGVWVGFLASYAMLLAVRPSSAVVVLAVIGAAAITDIGGYAIGVPFGRHKVVPSVSPKKSWEGLAGGLLIATTLAATVLPLIGDAFTPVSAAVLAVTCGLASFVGDVVQSMIKRDLGVKDLGDFLPGHGGILDRVDGILLALPVGYYSVVVFG